MLRFITKRVIIYTALVLFVVPVLIFLAIGLSSKNNDQVSLNQVSTDVPLPSKEDVIRTFCNLIDEGRIDSVVGMMIVNDDSEKQAWGVMFNSLSSFKLISIKNSLIDNADNSFEVEIDATIKDGKEDYGWINGINKRWINLVEYEKGKYKIAGIATGP